MPVYLFTYHAYRSWMPDRQQGYVQKGQGIQPSSTALAKAYRSASKHPPVRFDRATQIRLIEKLLDIAKREGYRLHGVATESTHLHVIVSWKEESLVWKQVCGRIKNLLALCLSRAAGITGRPWFVRGASRKRVKSREHLEYLLHTYLPKHRGAQWYEGRGWVNLEGG